MSETRHEVLDVVAAIGLGIGGVFGIAGTLVSAAALRQTLWGIDGVALVAATALLAVKFLRQACDSLAAGFLVFAIGESLLVSGNAAGLAASVPSFGGGMALWGAGLLLISAPRQFPSWVRILGGVGAVLALITAAEIFWGEQLLPISSPLPFFAYPFVVATFAGWIWAILRNPGSREP